MKAILIGATLAIGLAGCVTSSPAPRNPRVAQIVIASGSGATLGTVDLVPSASGYRLSGTLQGLPAGVHGIHLHMVGVCDAPEFTSAGGHLNPAGRKHGALNPAGAHLGDLPNITASADGLAQLNVELPGSRTDLDRDLFDHDGTALVAHAIADDYLTDPSGNSGSRVACGVLKRG